MVSDITVLFVATHTLKVKWLYLTISLTVNSYDTGRVNFRLHFVMHIAYKCVIFDLAYLSGLGVRIADATVL
jgi:hypothetical protein